MALNVLSSINEIFRRDVAVDDVTLVTPTHADCLVAGEWVKLDANGQADIGSRASADPLFYQVFTKKGDYSAQTLGKVTILNSFDYIAETDQFTGTPAAGAYLTVNSDGVLLATTTTNHVAVAIALNTPTGTDLLKYQRISPMQLN
jgi:hypothetical protein